MDTNTIAASFTALLLTACDGGLLDRIPQVEFLTIMCDEFPEEGVDIGGRFPVVLICEGSTCTLTTGVGMPDADHWTTSDCFKASSHSYLSIALLSFDPTEHLLTDTSIDAQPGAPLMKYCYETIEGTYCHPEMGYFNEAGDLQPTYSDWTDGYLLVDWVVPGTEQVLSADDFKKGIAPTSSHALVYQCPSEDSMANCEPAYWKVNNDLFDASYLPQDDGIVRIWWIE